jgi:hypothetical protein
MSFKLYDATLGRSQAHPRPSLLRRVTRRVFRLGCLHAVFMAGCAANAAFNVDHTYQLERKCAVKQAIRPQPGSSALLSFLKFWAWPKTTHRGVSTPRQLSEQELECVQAVTSLFAFDLHPRVMDKLMPDVALYDPWFTLRGSLELRDAWYFLSCLCRKADPIVTAVARSTENHNQLFVDMETDFELRLVGVRFTMPSSVRVTLQPLGPLKRRVELIEHRWFGGGPIAGTPSYPDHFLARAADALRHMDGFAMSVMMSTEHLVERYAAQAKAH